MNFYERDRLFQEIVRDSLDDTFFTWADRQLREFGAMCGGAIDERAIHTDREGQPRLIKYDKFGEDQSYVWLNEGYRQTVKETYGMGIVGYVHKDIPELGRRGNYLYSFAQGYLLSQAEPGFYCPVTLTLATAYLIEHYASKELKERFLPHVTATGESDGGPELYEGATFLTERQGGSDVGANETRAVLVESGDSKVVCEMEIESDDGLERSIHSENGVADGPAGSSESGNTTVKNAYGAPVYRLYGEKYFASNTGACGVVAVLARPEGAPAGTKGLSLFLVPWQKEDGSLNGLSIRRLKDKLGVRAVPSGEVEFDGSEAYLVGEKERGFYYMMEALNLSRICNAVASIGIMRRAYSEAFDYTSAREAFGNQLLTYPMVQDTLVRLKVKLEAETVAVFELAKKFDDWVAGEDHGDGVDRATGGELGEGSTAATAIARSVEEKDGYLRLLIALLKAESAEQAIHFSHEAIEMHGGNGYIEDFVTPRLLRDAQVLTVWEGTANILGLELLRLFKKWQMDKYFVKELETEVAQLSGDVAELSVELKKYIARLKMELVRFSKLNSYEKTRVIKQLQKKMMALYEGMLLVKRADKRKESEKGKRDDRCQGKLAERSKVVASIYLKDQLKPLWGDNQEMWTLEEGQLVLNEPT